MFSFNEKKDTISSPQDTNNYLRSNLAQLTPEKNIYNNYQLQSPLTSGMFGAQFSMNSMPKTQETSWMRPNAQSELASAMPVLSQNQPETSPSYTQTQFQEGSTFQASSINQPEKGTGTSVPSYIQVSSLPFPSQTQPELTNDFPTILTRSDITKPMMPATHSFNTQIPQFPIVNKKENIPLVNHVSSTQQKPSIMGKLCISIRCL